MNMYRIFGIDWGAEDEPFSFILKFNPKSQEELVEMALEKHLRDNCSEWLVCELDDTESTMISILSEFRNTISLVERKEYPNEPVLYVTCRPYRGENTEMAIYCINGGDYS